MTEKDDEHYRKTNVCQFCEENIESDRVRDHCHLTGKYRDPAHNTCNINVTQKKSILIPFVFHNCSFYDCHLFCKMLVDKRTIK